MAEGARLADSLGRGAGRLQEVRRVVVLGERTAQGTISTEIDDNYFP